MRNTRSQQTDGRKLVRLRELGFQFHALGDVIHDDEPPDHVEIPRDQRRNGGIDDPGFSRRGRQAEFVEIVNP